MDLRGKRGFVWKGEWYPNGGYGHEKNAMNIISAYNKRYPDENWNWITGSAIDFLVLKKRAIQIGNGTKARCVIAAAMYYSERDIMKFKRNHNIEDYDVILLWR